MLSALAALTALAILPGCQQRAEPKGQVVATVNGEEITVSELRAEAEAVGADLSAPGVRNQILETVVQRQVRAAAASQRGLDKDPRFLAHKRRAEQQILAQMYLMATRAGVEDADIREARSFILRNPALFDERELLVLERVAFAPAGVVTRAEAEPVRSLAEAERLLAQKNVRFDRRTTKVDPADLPDQMAATLRELEAGTVFFTRQRDGGAFATIVAREASPVPVDEQVARARSILRRKKEQQAVESAVAGLRKGAKISYQSGYGPASGAKPVAPKQSK
jgi:EpsD family peptidyl-prolyl cis-trans isomerase